ncbi:scarecrow-like protein 30 [Amaranthus tricolor]|uniref:scarecrow-like protein 30 n=1 Tax=Amaranthus tricolor TaxID=29722 RepID=UPI00258D13A6|nr:scarecrow-like protein 30 [Amaranthus tricolor]
MYPVVIDPQLVSLSHKLKINPELLSNFSNLSNFGNGSTQDVIFGNGIAQDVVFGNGITQDESFRNGLTQDEIFGNGITQDEIFRNEITQNEIFGIGMTQDAGIFGNGITQDEIFQNEMNQDEIFQNHNIVVSKTQSGEFSESCISPDSVDVPDFSDACIKFLSDILEEDLDEIPATIHDFRALQATEKSLYDALGEEYSSSDNPSSSFEHSIESPDDNGVDGYFLSNTPSFESNWVQNQIQLKPFISLSDLSDSNSEVKPQSSGSTNTDGCIDGLATSTSSTLTSVAQAKVDKGVSQSRKKKNQRRDNGGNDGGRSNKQQASSNEDYVEMRQYDDILLCREDKYDLTNCDKGVNKKLQGNNTKSKTTRGKKQNNAVEEVDLRTLLTHCAQAVASFDLRAANERLKQIRLHSSPYGDSIQRLAHYFANGLEARLAGTGSTVSGNIVDAHMSASDFLKAYRVYVSTIPWHRMSYFVANNAIIKLAEKATRIHIVDFGVLLGLQWPCLIQNLAKRSNGPPRLRITGIDYPQQGFRPAERVEATGRRLAGYCERFNVPFKYQGIANKWDCIMPEDINIEDDELVIVNCMFRSGTLLDETVEVDSQKDAFLRLIKQLNPSLFIHGIVNGTYNAPFFITRFREALFHFSSLFDIFEETNPREEHERLLIESELNAREALNVIACEGAERIQRPETYKQWQARTIRAGFKHLPLDRDLLGKAKAMVKANYHKDFVVDEIRNWMLQGWKGKTMFALSFWQS